MAYEFKKLSDVNVIESTNENAHVLAEQDGEIVRIPASSVSGGLPSGGAPHQQLVTDANGVAKWEDRLAYTEDCEIIHRQTVSCEVEEAGLYGSRVDGHLTYELLGKSLKVVFDGVEYECEAVKFSGSDGVNLGNTSLFGVPGGNGEPFVIFDQGNCVIFVSEPGEHEICILESHIKTIDPKYLPASVGGGGFMRIDISVNEGEVTGYANVSGVEITEALNNGLMPYCLLAGMILPLQRSDRLSSVSTMAASAMHVFTGLYIKGTSNSMVYTVEIDSSNPDTPCPVNLVAHKLAAGVLELVT